MSKTELNTQKWQLWESTKCVRNMRKHKKLKMIKFPLTTTKKNYIKRLG